MDIVKISEIIISKIKHLFGDVEHSLETSICQYEGVYRQVKFYHPNNRNIWVVISVYNKENMCIYTTKTGSRCFRENPLQQIFSHLEDLREVA